MAEQQAKPVKPEVEVSLTKARVLSAITAFPVYMLDAKGVVAMCCDIVNHEMNKLVERARQHEQGSAMEVSVRQRELEQQLAAAREELRKSKAERIVAHQVEQAVDSWAADVEAWAGRAARLGAEDADEMVRFVGLAKAGAEIMKARAIRDERWENKLVDVVGEGPADPEMPF